MPFASPLRFALNFSVPRSMLGSLVSSSRFVVRHARSQVDWDRALVVVEYGPGRRHHHARRPRAPSSGGQLGAIEMNCHFMQFLEAQIRDPGARLAASKTAGTANLPE
jgi:phospholipid N-methyltransferase